MKSASLDGVEILVTKKQKHFTWFCEFELMKYAIVHETLKEDGYPIKHLYLLYENTVGCCTPTVRLL